MSVVLVPATPMLERDRGARDLVTSVTDCTSTAPQCVTADVSRPALMEPGVASMVGMVHDEDRSGVLTTGDHGPRVCIIFAVRSRVSGGSLAALAEELTLIWRSNGVEIVYPMERAGECAGAVSRTVVLWIADAPSQLLPGMKVPLGTIGGTIVVGGVPTDMGYLLVARVSPEPQVPCWQGRSLGRIAAHELGHMLLRTIEHSDRGLMRAAFARSELLASSTARETFRLNALQRDKVQRELAPGAPFAQRP